jgi:hypothetical protein
MAKNNNGRTESFEKMLFKAADKLRKNIDARGNKSERGIGSWQIRFRQIS